MYTTDVASDPSGNECGINVSKQPGTRLDPTVNGGAGPFGQTLCTNQCYKFKLVKTLVKQ